MYTCGNCGEKMHRIYRECVSPPKVLIINMNRAGQRKSLVDHQITVNDQICLFKSSINFHPHHYTAVGCVEECHYVYYSDEEVQSCHGNFLEDGQNYQIMNRVRTPLDNFATVLLYEMHN